MENYSNIQNKDFRVFLPLINILLFNSSETPRFQSNSENLSNSYIDAYKLNKEADLEKNDIYNNILKSFLVSLNTDQRSSISNIILKNDAYIAGISVIYAIEKHSLNENFDTILEQNILLDLISFKLSGTFSKNVLTYLFFHFENIYNYEFSNTDSITKEQYNYLIEKLCTTKDFKDNFNLTA